MSGISHTSEADDANASPSKLSARRTKVEAKDGSSVIVVRVRGPDGKMFIARRMDTGDVDATSIIKARNPNMRDAELSETLRPFLDLSPEPTLEGHWVSKKDAKILADQYDLEEFLDVVLKKKAIGQHAVVASDPDKQTPAEAVDPVAHPNAQPPAETSKPSAKATDMFDAGPIDGQSAKAKKPRSTKSTSPEGKIRPKKQKSEKHVVDDETSSKSDEGIGKSFLESRDKLTGKLAESGAQAAKAAADAPAKVKETASSILQPLSDTPSSKKSKKVKVAGENKTPKSQEMKVTAAVAESRVSSNDVKSGEKADRSVDESKLASTSKKAKKADSQTSTTKSASSAKEAGVTSEPNKSTEVKQTAVLSNAKASAEKPLVETPFIPQSATIQSAIANTTDTVSSMAQSLSSPLERFKAHLSKREIPAGLAGTGMTDRPSEGDSTRQAEGASPSSKPAKSRKRKTEQPSPGHAATKIDDQIVPLDALTMSAKDPISTGNAVTDTPSTSHPPTKRRRHVPPEVAQELANTELNLARTKQKLTQSERVNRGLAVLSVGLTAALIGTQFL